MKKSLFSIVTVLLLVGCGGSGGGTQYTTEAPVMPDIPTEGNAIIVTANDDSNAVMSYTQVSDNGILIECGEGGCGDIFVGSEIPKEEGPSIDSGCGTDKPCEG